MLVLAGCGFPLQPSLPTELCERQVGVVRENAGIDEIDEQVAILERAIDVCSSLADLEAAMAIHVPDWRPDVTLREMVLERCAAVSNLQSRPVCRGAAG